MNYEHRNNRLFTAESLLYASGIPFERFEQHLKEKAQTAVCKLSDDFRVGILKYLISEVWGDVSDYTGNADGQLEQMECMQLDVFSDGYINCGKDLFNLVNCYIPRSKQSQATKCLMDYIRVTHKQGKGDSGADAQHIPCKNKLITTESLLRASGISYESFGKNLADESRYVLREIFSDMFKEVLLYLIDHVLDEINGHTQSSGSQSQSLPYMRLTICCGGEIRDGEMLLQFVEEHLSLEQQSQPTKCLMDYIRLTGCKQDDC